MDPAEDANYYLKSNLFSKKCIANISRGAFCEKDSQYCDVTIANIQAHKDWRKVDPELFDLIAFDQIRGSITQTFINIGEHFNKAKIVFVNLKEN